MAVITGVLADFGRAALSTSSIDRAPVIEFHPSGPGVRVGESVLYASRVITVTPAVSTGEWTADLELTSILRPHVWYEVVVKWLDAAGNFITVDYVPGRLYVDGPGEFSDMFRVRNAPWFAWVTDEPVVPDGANPSDLVLDSMTGDLYRVA